MKQYWRWTQDLWIKRRHKKQNGGKHSEAKYSSKISSVVLHILATKRFFEIGIKNNPGMFCVRYGSRVRGPRRDILVRLSTPTRQRCSLPLNRRRPKYNGVACVVGTDHQTSRNGFLLWPFYNAETKYSVPPRNL